MKIHKFFDLFDISPCAKFILLLYLLRDMHGGFRFSLKYTKKDKILCDFRLLANYATLT